MNEPQQNDATRFPRRFKKKRETRDRIIAAASRLFRQVGYSDATMVDIAEAADVHVTTLFTHFKAKKDLAAAISEVSIGRLEQKIEDAKGRVPFLEFFRGLIEDWAKTYAGAPELNISYGHQLREEPELAFSWLQYQRREIWLYTDYIASDYGLDPVTDYRPALVANMLSAGNVIAHDRWLDANGTSDLQRDALAALDAAESLVVAALEGARALS